MSDDLVRQLVAVGRKAVAAGLVIGSGGNLSARLPGSGTCVVTCSGSWLDELTPADFSYVDIETGQVREGHPRPSSEVQLHLATYRVRTANATPAVFGLLETVLRRLGETAEQRGDRTAALLAERLGEEGAELRRAAYALLDHVPAAEQVEDRLALRAAGLELVARATTALVVATGGAAMSLAAPAQRLAREALFHLVQAQTPAVRAATLDHLLERTA